MQQKKQIYKVIGLMSGTSLDGLDICYAYFWETGLKWNFQVHKATTLKYVSDWKQNLSASMKLSESALNELDVAYGSFLGSRINDFISSNGLNSMVDIIASHGHTVFHQPQKGFTRQIGDGNTIANLTGIATVYNFRTLDVSLGGQGAPLVPIGDKLLFAEHNACLNLGGIANISFDRSGKRIAFDICPANYPLNRLCRKMAGCDYDQDGKIASNGNVIEPLLMELNDLPFYRINGPKSLGAEWMNQEFFAGLKSRDTENCADLLRTIVEHETDQIAKVLTDNLIDSVFVTGGGAYNGFMIERLKAKSKVEIIIPSNEIVEFKEALTFGFLGVLRWLDRVNTLSSVTGAAIDSSGGIIALPNSET